MRVEFNAPDEVRIVSPTTFTDNYARNERNNLLDFFRNGLNCLVRVTTDVVEDAAAMEAASVKVLSKSEQYEVMAQKNPNLSRLKDLLNLQMEY
jgi:hypothetical protein